MSEIQNVEPLDCYDGAAELELNYDEDDEKYRLTEWGCLLVVLSDYGIDVTNIPGRVGKHIVEDFMELMRKAGYIAERDEEQDD